VSVASFIASQRADHAVPHALCCKALGVSESWFYKWHERPPTPRQARRAALDKAVRESFEASGGRYGSPRVHDDLVDAGWAVSEKTVAASMAAQGLAGRPKRRYHSLTRPDKAAKPFADLVNRDFRAPAINDKWCGDLTEIPTQEGKLYLASVLDLASRRVAGFSIGEHHDAELAAGALKMAAAIRGGDVKGAVFHSDRGSEFSASLFGKACSALGVSQSMGRVGSCFDNAAVESWHSTLEFECLRRWRFASKAEARREVARFIDWYNRARRHSACQGKSPVEFEALLAERTAKAGEEPDAA
jgi:putative transposase